jgi:hypothetical protein
MRDDGKALLAEFHADKEGKLFLFTLYTGDEHGIHTSWDVEWCKAFGSYVYHMSGAGRFKPTVSGIYWAATGMKVKTERLRLIDKEARKRNRTHRLATLPEEFEGMDLLDYLETNAFNEEAVYCTECDDWLPGHELCVHCWWCDEGGWYSTPSERMKLCSEEYCGCRTLDICDCGEPKIAHQHGCLQVCPSRKGHFTLVAEQITS